ncbi:peptide chain release factor N(5)-glutamine methyltransferase [Marinobacter salicampi]|uniref:peptide chain release factor N(5)-glutamine methyltransferase n=1 Tax=Marinobacter salicampi TaxID=435907 RepID=UPI0014073ED4|nr:peptide chain release factor N(5)-glutamine methyltransferase [Marinobacter salicampi]
MSDAPLTTEALLRIAAASFESDTPRLDAELLLADATGWSRTSFRAWPERVPDTAQRARFQAQVEERRRGRPIAHILGEQGFWSLSLVVNDATLIPRPDTECLVEAALALALPAQAHVLDLGTGTGAIALALASERPSWQIMACDCVPAAVELARLNASKLGLPIDVVTSHWFAGLSGQRFDLIVSNPPYIARADTHLFQGDVRYEPETALVAGADGLDDLRHLILHGSDRLVANGWLLVEHGHDQGEAVRDLFKACAYADIATGQDYGDRDRYTLGRKPSNTTAANPNRRDPHAG